MLGDVAGNLKVEDEVVQEQPQPEGNSTPVAPWVAAAALVAAVVLTAGLIFTKTRRSHTATEKSSLLQYSKHA